MARVATGSPTTDFDVQVVIIGAGACGLTAALRAVAAGAEVVVLERDPSPSGSTSMSSGFVPAPGTRFQRAAGVPDDTPDRFLSDIEGKSHGLSEPHLARLAADTIGPAIEWLADHGGVEWEVLTGFLYPNHSRHRMHAVPEKTGAALEARLLAAAEAAGIPIVTDAHADTLWHEGNRITAVEIARPDGRRETIGCAALVLACNGYGGNAELMARHIPEIVEAVYYGHAGNTGDALLWGEALGARTLHLSGYQGHGSLAHPQGIPISWALMMEGGIQVNAEGRRFSNENGGYSEQAVHVLGQPGGVVWDIFDKARHDFAMEGFPDYREAEAAGAIRQAPDVAGLAAVTGLPEAALGATLDAARALAARGGTDDFGRRFGKPPLEPPYHAVKVTAALFHTQGGLLIDGAARVLAEDGTPFANLFAGGGAACGVSGPDVSGYLSGNGLLTAISFGYLAGDGAARLTAAR